MISFMKYLVYLCVYLSIEERVISDVICPSEDVKDYYLSEDDHNLCEREYFTPVEHTNYGKCPDDLFCTDRENTETYCEKYYVPPGMEVKYQDDCTTEKMNKYKMCTGKGKGAICHGDAECGVGLECHASHSTRMCEELHPVGDACNASERCAPYALCVNGQCEIYFSLPAGAPNPQYLDDACQSGWVDRTTSLCATQGWSTLGDIELSPDLNCTISYQGADVTHDPHFLQFIRPQCIGLHSQKGLCKKGPNNQGMAKERNYVYQFLSTEKPECHLSSSIYYGMCDHAKNKPAYPVAYVGMMRLRTAGFIDHQAKGYLLYKSPYDKRFAEYVHISTSIHNIERK